MEDITLTIRGKQFTFDDTGEIDMTVMASMNVENGKYIINYIDQDNCEMRVTVKDDAVMMKRVGYNETHMIFEKSKPYTISYNTSFGIMELSMFTTMVDTDVCDSAGKIEIEYLTDFMGEQVVNKLNISYVADNRN